MQEDLEFAIRQMKSLFRLDLKQSRNQVLQFRREMGYILFVIRLTRVVFDQFFFVFAFP